MTGRSRGPGVLKGAFVTMPTGGGAAQVIAFRYNPAALKRSLQPQLAGGEPRSRAEAVRFTGPPVQTVTIEIEIDATDGLASRDPTAVRYGALPELALLERLIYPSLQQVNDAAAQLADGVMEIAPATAPRTLFVWGAQRVLPVQLSGLEITEELFDGRLNPIQARAQVTMRVLTYADLAASDRSYHDFVTYQQNLDALAGVGTTGNDAAAVGVDLSGS